MILSDIWNVWILGKHKHRYMRIEDGHVEINVGTGTLSETRTITWQMHRCAECKKTVGLDDWQIADLPADMLYEKLPHNPIKKK